MLASNMIVAQFIRRWKAALLAMSCVIASSATPAAEAAGAPVQTVWIGVSVALTGISSAIAENVVNSARLAVQAATGGTTATFPNIVYAAWAGEQYAITPVYIEATQGFQETLQWPANVTAAATARLFSRLRGYLIRNAQ